MAESASLSRAYELLRERKLKEASDIARELLQRDASQPRYWALLRDINAQANRHKQAIYSAGKVLEFAPDDLTARLQLAKVLVNAGEQSRALAELAKIPVQVGSDGAVLNDSVGALYSMCDEPQRAISYASAAVEAQPDNALFHSNLAMIHRMLGDFTASEQGFTRAIQLNPHDYRAHYSRSDLKRWSHEENHIADMRKILSLDVQDWRGEVALRFALAKECEDLENYEDAFSYLKTACDLQRQHTRYDVAQDVTAMTAIAETFTASEINRMKPGCESNEPIFVMGLPRTGTTLVERILGSHSQVFAAGELNNFAAQVVSAVREQAGTGSIDKTETIKNSVGLNFEELGNAYVKSTRPRTGHTPRFIDKLPLNYLYAGLIHCALPKAKLILLERDPMDACFAMYRMLFVGIYPFSYDLDDIAAYYNSYRKLVDHWLRVIGDSILLIKYEDLVDDIGRETRRILDYCELPFEASCVDFHSSTAPSTTASAVQVRQPIYRSSIGKWRRYEKHLTALKERLGINGIAS